MQNIPLNTVKNVSVAMIHTKNIFCCFIETVQVRICSIVVCLCSSQQVKLITNNYNVEIPTDHF